MPAYKYTLKNGKTMWYANFYYTDWTGEKKHICKRGFKTQREAKEYEKSFMVHEHLLPGYVTEKMQKAQEAAKTENISRSADKKPSIRKKSFSWSMP